MSISIVPRVVDTAVSQRTSVLFLELIIPLLLCMKFVHEFPCESGWGKHLSI